MAGLTSGVVVVRLVLELALDPVVDVRAQAVVSTESVDVVVAETSKVVSDGKEADTVVTRDPVASERGPLGHDGVVGSLGEVVGGRDEVEVGDFDRRRRSRGQGEGQGGHDGDESGGDGEAHFDRDLCERVRWSEV